MTVRERMPDYCQWGCGQLKNQHSANWPCPPQNAQGHWLNGPDKALGATPQLHEDVRELTRQSEAIDCASCKRVLRRRMSIITGELTRRGFRG